MVDGSRQRSWNWIPATRPLMEDGCIFGIQNNELKGTYDGNIDGQKFCREGGTKGVKLDHAECTS